MKTHYQLLDLQSSASAEEIKRAFRREIARYHPDKVQHLGPEFQEIAATRAAELTEAYRVLMDANLRQQYDEALAGGAVATAARAATAPPAAAPPQAESAAASSRPAPEPQAPPGPDRRFHQDRTAVSDVVRKAIVAKLRSAVAAVAGEAVSVPTPPFDAVFTITPKKALFKKSESAVRLFVRIVPQVDPEAIEEVWPLVAKGPAGDTVICVLLFGSGLASARVLGGAIAEQRRKSRAGVPVVVPIDIRDWEALFPPEAPDIVRRIIDRLRTTT